MQSEHKRTSYFQNYAENKSSHPHQSTEKPSKFCFKWPEWLLLLLSLAFARCHYLWKWLPPTTEELEECSETESVTTVQSAFRTEFHTEPPSQSIHSRLVRNPDSPSAAQENYFFQRTWMFITVITKPANPLPTLTLFLRYSFNNIFICTPDYITWHLTRISVNKTTVAVLCVT